MSHNEKARDNSVTIGVADDHIGLVLGRGGWSIKEIQQVSGAMIKISGKGDFIHGTFERKVTITGSARAIQLAKDMITQKVSFKASGSVVRFIDWRSQFSFPIYTDNVGYCWAYVTAELIGTKYLIDTKQYLVISPQQFIDLYQFNYDNPTWGCVAGMLDILCNYIIPCTTYDNYPLVGTKQNYNLALVKHPIVYVKRVKSCSGMWQQAEKDLEVAVQTQPIGVHIDASGPIFSAYKGFPKIFKWGVEVLSLNHFMVVYGVWETEEGEAYWILKNVTWGDDWGDKSFIYFPKGQNFRGIATGIVWPTISGNILGEFDYCGRLARAFVARELKRMPRENLLGGDTSQDSQG